MNSKKNKVNKFKEHLVVIPEYPVNRKIVREFTKNNIRILPVFLPVFCVAIMKEYSNIPSLSRLEYE